MAVAASSSVGSDIFAVVALISIASLVLLTIRHYLPLRSTPAYLLVPVFLALALPCSIILLVPIDLASADSNETQHSRGVWLPETVILITWRITYWLTFSLTWFILPFLGEYCDSGYRDPRSRTIYSLRNNARYQLIIVTTAIAGLVYFIWQNGFHGQSIKGLVMALAYAWGLFLAIGLMGHGLVALPRRLFKSAGVGSRLRQLQTQAPRTRDKLDEASDALEQLEQTVAQLKRHKGGASREQQEWIDELADTSSLPPARPGLNVTGASTTPSVPAVVTDRYLADITRKLKRARHRKARFVEEWSKLCEQAQKAQSILDSAASKKLTFSRSSPSGRGWVFITPSMRYHLHMNILPASRVVFSVVLAVASLLIIWSELINPIAPKLSVIGISVVHHPDSTSGGKVNFGGQLIAAAWLLYMDVSALYAMSDVKVWGNRALVTRQTYAESACWYSLQVAKLTVPLSYNFITMMPEAIYQQTSFYRFLGKLIDLTPLGEGFSAFFPCVLLLPALATLLNLYGKAKAVLGFGLMEDDSDDNPTGFGTGGWREGRALIERELQSRSAEGRVVGLTTRGESLDLERGLLQNRTAAGGAVSSSSAASSPPPRQALRSNPNTNNDLLSSSSSSNNDDDPRSSAGLASTDTRVRDANRQFNAITNRAHVDADDDDDSPRHFYQDIAERVRNTFDTTERPEWIRNLSSGFKKPKWMQNEQRDGSGGGGSGSGAGGAGGPLSRFFGGRAEDGQVRL